MQERERTQYEAEAPLACMIMHGFRIVFIRTYPALAYEVHSLIHEAWIIQSLSIPYQHEGSLHDIGAMQSFIS